MPGFLDARSPIVRFALRYAALGLAIMALDFLSDLLPFGHYMGVGRAFIAGAFLVLGGVSLIAHHLLFHRLLQVRPHRMTTAFELATAGFSIAGGVLFALLMLAGITLYGADEAVPDSLYALLLVPGALAAYGVALLLWVALRRLFPGLLKQNGDPRAAVRMSGKP